MAKPKKNQDEFLEKRKTARLDIPIKVEYRAVRSEEAKTAVTKNISSGGCLFLTTEELPIGSEIELNIFLGGTESEALVLKGVIVREARAEKGLHEFGIAFDGMSREAKRLFADFCFAKMYELIGLSEWPTDRRLKK